MVATANYTNGSAGRMPKTADESADDDAQAPASPNAPPTTTRFVACHITQCMTLDGEAPNAMRSPIAFTCCATVKVTVP